MLPLESIRFFRVDQEWVDCLADGAFSIGRRDEKNSRVTRRVDLRTVRLTNGGGRGEDHLRCRNDINVELPILKPRQLEV